MNARVKSSCVLTALRVVVRFVLAALKLLVIDLAHLGRCVCLKQGLRDKEC